MTPGLCVFTVVVLQGALTDDMVDDIKSLNTSFAMNDKLLHVLPHRGDQAYNTLLAALRHGSGQIHLVHLLQNTTVLTEGKRVSLQC